MIIVNITLDAIYDCVTPEGCFEVQNLPLSFNRLLSKLSEFTQIDNPHTVSSDSWQCPQTGAWLTRSMHLVSETTPGLWANAVNLVVGEQ